MIINESNNMKNASQLKSGEFIESDDRPYEVLSVKRKSNSIEVEVIDLITKESMLSNFDFSESVLVISENDAKKLIPKIKPDPDVGTLEHFKKYTKLNVDNYDYGKGYSVYAPTLKIVQDKVSKYNKKFNSNVRCSEIDRNSGDIRVILPIK